MIAVGRHQGKDRHFSFPSVRPCPEFFSETVHRKSLIFSWRVFILTEIFCPKLGNLGPNLVQNQFLGLASSPYVTSTVSLSVRQTRLSYFPPLDFSDFLHQASLL